MSWFTDEETAVLNALKEAAQHPLLPQIKQKIESAKAELAEVEPILTIVEALYPPSAVIITGAEAVVNTTDAIIDGVPNPNYQAAD